MKTDSKKHAGGRPIAANPLCIDIKVRLTADDARRLDSYCTQQDTKRAAAIRAAILRMLDDADGGSSAADPESPAL